MYKRQTQLTRWLASHPDIDISPVKEPNYYSQHEFSPEFVARDRLNDVDPQRYDPRRDRPAQFAVFRQADSYAALFDPKFRGYVSIEDNYTTAGQKTALYLKKSGMADIADPADMTPGELKTVIDFLIEKKKEGQFRVIWSSFEQAVNLLVNQEVHVMDCWEPMVFVANQKGANVKYAAPKEGYLLWAMAAYLVDNPERSEEQTKAAYALLDFMLGPWYGATITQSRGYMTNPQAAEFAAQSDLFDAEAAKRIAAIDALEPELQPA